MKLTEEDLKELMDAYKAMVNAPVMALSVEDGLSGNDFSGRARQAFLATWGRLCVKYKIDPDVAGFNSQTGEIV